MRPSALQPRSESLAALIEQVHAIGKEVIGPNAEAVDRDARFPAEAFQALKAAKLLSCYVPVELGGMGLTISELSKLCETLAL